MPIIGGSVSYSKNTEIEETTKILTETAQTYCQDKLEIIYSSFFKIIAGKRNIEAKGEKVISFCDKKGVIIGRLHSTNSKEKITTSYFNENVHAAILKTQGRWLGENIWGSYLCVLFDNDTNSIHIFRDPSGLSSLYFTIFQDSLLFSSELSILEDALPVKSNLDWEFFTSYVAYSDLMSMRTPFCNIQELLPGQHLSFSSKGYKINPFWSPFLFSFPRDIKDLSRNIVDVFVDSTEKWIEESPSLCLNLSGGLDSTALLLAIKKNINNKKHFFALNYTNPEIASSNELEHARKIAKKYDVELLEFDINEAPSLSIASKPHERWNKPNSTSLNQKRKQEMGQMVSQYGHVEFIDGFGGDQLFIANVERDFLCDYILNKGLKGFLHKLIETCQINRQSAIDYSLSTVSNLISYNYKNKLFFKVEPSWFQPKFKELIRREILYPPFWQEIKKLPPGKAKHVFAIYQGSFYAENGLSSYGRSIIYPFLSQPLIELALSIPTYETYGGDYSRNIFRNAISQHFQTDLVWRQSKGETSGIFQLGLYTNRKRALELCMEGQFAQQGLLIKEELYNHIKKIEHGLITHQWPLINLLAAELWFEAWGYQ
ncbi:MAG: hypothetical protein JNJ47_00180 [Alphaproteobacteria bacterium]|nr:hypothetical protein [Alphaproteobacteria bacterium]